MRVAYLAAGAAGMYCGSCLRDHRLAAALIAKGRDVVLIPLYTPLRTEEPYIGRRRVLYGGINVYLQQKSSLFRHTPRIVDTLFDSPMLLRGAGSFATGTKPGLLGSLTVSVLKGEDGFQRKELDKLLDVLREIQPDLVHLPNLMFVGIAGAIKQALGVSVLCTLSGEDVFLDQLPAPYREQAFGLIRDRSRDVDAFVAVTCYFADRAADHFSLPPDRTHVIPMGINVDGFDRSGDGPDGPFIIGYLARICPQKGLAQLAEAFLHLRREGRDCRLHVAGYLEDRAYLHEVRQSIERAGATDHFRWRGEVSRSEKIEFLQSLHMLSVPAVYPEAKGLYLLEALAAGVPVVQPRRGSFPEIIQATSGGLLYDPEENTALAAAIARLMDDPVLRARLGRDGQRAVRSSFTDDLMAERTWSLYERLCPANDREVGDCQEDVP